MNEEIGAEAAQFPEKEYINRIEVAVEGNFFPGREVRDFFLVERGIFPRVGKKKIPPPPG